MILRTALIALLASNASAFFVAPPRSTGVVVRQPSLQVSLSDPTGADTEIPQDDSSEEVQLPEPTEESTEASTEASVTEEDAAPKEDASEGEDASKVLPPTERYTIYVGNLPYSVSVKEVRELFAEHCDVRYVNLPRHKETGSIKGFAFVDVATEEDIPKAVDAMNGQDLQGRMLRVSRSLPKDQVRSLKKSFDGSKKLYVGNVAFATTKEDLQEYFGGFGEITDVFIPVNSYGEPRGFAFVSIKEADTEAVMEATNGMEFMGRNLVVNLPLPPGEKKQVTKRERPGRVKLFVGNLSFYTSGDTLTEVFEEFGQVYDCYIPEDPATSNSRGFGFLTMGKDEANAAVEELDGCELDGRIITVNPAKPRVAKSEEDDSEGESDTDSEAP